MYTHDVDKVIENYRRWKRIETAVITVMLSISGGSLGAVLMLRVIVKYHLMAMGN